jgi:glycosyltransferase involved in cell wall biosynthesis
VWLLPTEAENFSLAVLEALAAGCAIVSTPCRGNDEVLVHDQNALLAPVGDVDALAGCLRCLLADRARRERLRDGARRTSRITPSRAWWTITWPVIAGRGLETTSRTPRPARREPWS